MIVLTFAVAGGAAVADSGQASRLAAPRRYGKTTLIGALAAELRAQWWIVCVSSLRRIDSYLVRWAVSKYKRLKRSQRRARKLLVNVYEREPGLFAHWRLTRARDGMVGAG